MSAPTAHDDDEPAVSSTADTDRPHDQPIGTGSSLPLAGPGDTLPQPSLGRQVRLPNIPGFRVETVIESGGQGIVYRAVDLSLDRPVAVKLLLDSRVLDDQFRVRFHREGRAIAGLEHANIVRVFSSGEAEHGPYIVMELLAGGSLRNRLSAVGVMPPEEAADLVAKLADAIQHAHDRGIVHRDLKPGNVLFAADGTPKVVDFGLAKRLDDANGPATTTGAILGTIAYMAPEQATGRTKELTPAVDVYGLGAILYQCLTGRPPFTGHSLPDMLDLIRYNRPDPPSRSQSRVGPGLDGICLQCLEKKPSDRFASASQLAHTLRRFLDGEIVTVHFDGAVRPMEPPSATADQVKIPGYEIIGLVARGGLGVVYKARQIATKRVVALKLLHADMPGGDRQRLVLLREAHALARLSHPNIVQYVDHGEHGPFAYVATEFIDGTTLQRSVQGGPQPIPQAIHLVELIARAVGHVHKHGIVHRDLKPSNFLLQRAANDAPSFVDSYGIPKVTDFGSAFGGGMEALDSADSIVGTPVYMSPEQAEGDAAAVGPASDIWSLGVVLYQLLTGRLPIRGQNIVDVLERTRAGAIDPPSQVRPDLPAAVEDVCMRCLRKAPGDRFPSAEALADALAQARDAAPHGGSRRRWGWPRFWQPQ